MFKKITAVVLLVLCLSLLGGCAGGGSSSGPLAKPIIQADGKTLVLPCTFGELLDFGFIFEKFSAVDIDEDAKPEDTELNYSSGIQAYVNWSDGASYLVDITPLKMTGKTMARDCIVTAFADRDKWVGTGKGPGEEDFTALKGVSVCGVSRHQTYESAIDKFMQYGDKDKDYKKTEYTSFSLEAKEDSRLSMNGYEVRESSVYLAYYKSKDSDDVILKRIISLNSVRKPD